MSVRRCPRCADEYEADVDRCAECGGPLLRPDGTLTAPETEAEPVADARLGRFEPAVAEVVRRRAEQRGIAADAEPAETGVEVHVERHWRDDLRAELAADWADVLDELDDEQRWRLDAEASSVPGWLDGPEGGWVDRAGRVLVDVPADEGRTRTVGPALLGGAAILALLAWYAELGAAVIVIAVGVGILGLLLPR